MRILFITPPPYLPNRLHRIRSFELIKMLSKKYEVHLFSVVTETKQYPEFDEIKKVCKSITIIKINKLLSYLNCLRFFYLPAEVGFCYSQQVSKSLEKIIKKQKIDVLYIKRLRSTIFVPKVKVKKIIDTTDAMSMFYLRMFDKSSFPKNLLYLLEAVKYRNYEQKVFKSKDTVVVCSEIDKSYLQSISNISDISVIPNPVDTVFYNDKTKEEVIPNSLLFRGLMDKPVNIDAAIYFVNEIFPKVLRKIPTVRLFIAGPKPTTTIKRLHDNKHIFVTGYLHNLDLYKKISIAVCPLRIGSGTRHKIIQAWSMKKPVVSTTIGAEGLLYKNDYNIIVRDSSQEFADAIIELLNNNRKAYFISENGYKTAKRYYSNHSISRKLYKLIESL